MPGGVVLEKSVRVLVIDGQPMVGAALARALATEELITISGVASSLEQLEAICKQADDERSCPDVAVIDYQLPDGTGIDAAAVLQWRCPSLRSVLISAHNSVDRLREAVDVGCVAYLNKASQLDDLIRAVHAAGRGEATFDSDTLRSMIKDTRAAHSSAGFAGLSPRESQILAMLAGGATTEVMATYLHLSQYTVRNHVRNLTNKLGAHSRLEAVSIATRSGLLTLVEAAATPT